VESLSLVWNKLLISQGRIRDAIDGWHIQYTGLCQHLKGWGANIGKQTREAKAHILSQIKALDAQADSSGLDEEEWAFVTTLKMN
jgi:hypothetical protein